MVLPWSTSAGTAVHGRSCVLRGGHLIHALHGFPAAECSAGCSLRAHRVLEVRMSLPARRRWSSNVAMILGAHTRASPLATDVSSF